MHPQLKRLCCKSIHYHQPADLFPLQLTVFEGVNVFRPKNAMKLLAIEYGEKSMTLETYLMWKFDPLNADWIYKDYAEYN